MSMRTVNLASSAPSTGDPARLARLTRHLEARLQDFGPGGPEVRSADQGNGLIRARFSGRSPKALAEALEHRFGILVRTEGEDVVFQLTPEIPFEDLDYVWGCLFQVLGE